MGTLKTRLTRWNHSPNSVEPHVEDPVVENTRKTGRVASDSLIAILGSEIEQDPVYVRDAHDDLEHVATGRPGKDGEDGEP